GGLSGGARGGGGGRGRRAADGEAGQLALVRRRAGTSLGLIGGLDRRRHRLLVTVLLPHGVTVQMKEGNIKRVFWQPPPLHLPRDWERRTRSLSEQLERLSIPELMERERTQGPQG